MVNRVKKANKINWYDASADPSSGGSKWFGIRAKHDMNIENNLTKNAFRTYSMADRKGFPSLYLDFQVNPGVGVNRLYRSTTKGE
jgi:hypothetical protein